MIQLPITQTFPEPCTSPHRSQRTGWPGPDATLILIVAASALLLLCVVPLSDLSLKAIFDTASAESSSGDAEGEPNLGPGWALLERSLLIYCAVMLGIALLAALVLAIRGNLFATEEEQRERNSWFGCGGGGGCGSCCGGGCGGGCG